MSIRFSEHIETRGSFIRVFAPDGGAVAGEAFVDPHDTHLYRPHGGNAVALHGYA